MTRLHRALIASVALAAPTITGTVAWAGSALSAAAPTTYSYTLAGTDAHTLDARLGVMFFGDGGVEAVREPEAQYTSSYLELNLDLPVGAKVTSIAVTYTSCPG